MYSKEKCFILNVLYTYFSISSTYKQQVFGRHNPWINIGLHVFFPRPIKAINN